MELLRWGLSQARLLGTVWTRLQTRLPSHFAPLAEFKSLPGTCFLLCPLECCGQEARRAEPSA